MGEAGQGNLRRSPALALVVMVVVIAGAVGYAFVSASSGRTSASSSSLASTSLVINNLSLLIPQDRPACTTTIPLCQSDALLTATVSAKASTPLSCLDVYVNGSSEGSDCWNLTSPAFTETQCYGSGNRTSCTAIVSSNSNMETARTVPLSQQIFNGSNGTPLILVGKPYQVTIVGVFQDGSNSTVSAAATATMSNRFAVSSVSATTTAPRAP
jgi:hypothetical protein